MQGLCVVILLRFDVDSSLSTLDPEDILLPLGKGVLLSEHWRFEEDWLKLLFILPIVMKDSLCPPGSDLRWDPLLGQFGGRIYFYSKCLRGLRILFFSWQFACGLKLF